MTLKFLFCNEMLVEKMNRNLECNGIEEKQRSGQLGFIYNNNLPMLCVVKSYIYIVENVLFNFRNIF